MGSALVSFQKLDAVSQGLDFVVESGEICLPIVRVVDGKAVDIGVEVDRCTLQFHRLGKLILSSTKRLEFTILGFILILLFRVLYVLAHILISLCGYDRHGLAGSRGRIFNIKLSAIALSIHLSYILWVAFHCQARSFIFGSVAAAEIVHQYIYFYFYQDSMQ
jgi:hypothetical protein